MFSKSQTSPGCRDRVVKEIKNTSAMVTSTAHGPWRQNKCADSSPVPKQDTRYVCRLLTLSKESTRLQEQNPLLHKLVRSWVW